MCRGVFLSNSHFGTIFPFATSAPIRWPFIVFLKRLRVKPRPQAFLWFLQADIPTHAIVIDKWYFWNGFLTLSRLFSHKRFNKWIHLVVLFCFHIAKGHIPPWIACVLGVAYLLTMNKPSGGVCSHCTKGNIVSTHKVHFMLSISWHFCNTFPLALIHNYN
jgi:hypothetical protein